jgi:prepilin-type N-terminal cleavage/methylation domain-containing protein
MSREGHQQEERKPMQERDIHKRDERGFTLIELLIAIVVVGILAAVAIVGIAGLTNTGSNAACKASLDSATAASAAYYANNNNTWQANLQALAAATPKVWVTPNDSAGNPILPVGQVLTVGTWKLTETNPNGTTVEPTFACT